MSMPVQPGGSRGGPMLEEAAQQTIAATRQQPRYVRPPEGYEPDPLSADDRAEAEKTAQEEARICRYCIGIHRYPTTVACPRIAEVELNSDGSVRTAKFWPRKDWAKGRVALLEDLEEADDGG